MNDEEQVAPRYQGEPIDLCVGLVNAKGRRNLSLRWIDPQTGRRKSRSTGTSNVRKARRMASRLEASLYCEYGLVSPTTRKEMFRLDSLIRSRKEEIKDLKLKLEKLRSKVDFLQTALLSKEDWSCWPDVPPGSIEPTFNGDGLPRESGVYFVWIEGICAYVGQSIYLRDRCKLIHPKILPTDQLSFVKIAAPYLDFAECFYIGLLRPSRNFGKNASFVKYAAKKPNEA